MRKTKYTPIGEALCAETAWVQAALALDVAAFMAVESKDPTTLINISRGWNELACEMKQALEVSEEGEEHEHELAEDDAPRLVGFTANKESDNG